MLNTDERRLSMVSLVDIERRSDSAPVFDQVCLKGVETLFMRLSFTEFVHRGRDDNRTEWGVCHKRRSLVGQSSGQLRRASLVGDPATDRAGNRMTVDPGWRLGVIIGRVRLLHR